jgi:hypothetical protein
MKKLIALLVYFFLLLIFFTCWEYLVLPYNENNEILGIYYQKKINPFNNTLRFLTFTTIPTLFFLIFYLKSNKDAYSINPYNENYFLSKNKYISPKTNLNFYFLLISFFVIFDFFLIEFKYHFHPIDYFHEGTFLTPPINQEARHGFWTATIYEYGFISNNFASIIWKLIGQKTIGSVRFFLLTLMLFNKLLLIYISKLIVEAVNFDKKIKILFFIALALGAINLVRYKFYWVSFFQYRHFLYLLFIIFSIKFFKNQTTLKAFYIGLFSSVSFLWFLDIGLYINLLIVFIIFYFFLIRKYFISASIFFGVTVSWILIFLIFDKNEIFEAFKEVRFIYNIAPYLLGLEYIKPFTTSIFDWWTRPYIFFIFNFVLVAFLNFQKKLKVSYETKIIISFLLICSIALFQPALTRSSDKHIIYSLGTVLYLFYFCLLYFFFIFSRTNKFLLKIFSIIFRKKIFFFIFLFFMFSLFIFRFNFIKIKNFSDSITNFNQLLYSKDEKYLSNDYKSFLIFYEKLSKNDNCVQSLYDDLSLPYLLRKPSCTKYYAPTHIINGWTDNLFIEEFKQSMPAYVLYDGPYTFLTNKKNMKKVDQYIKENYIFYQNFKNWIIYVKK